MLAADRLMAHEPDIVTGDWAARDTILYNLGIGFGPPAAADPALLRYVLEDRLVAFPTMATVQGMALGIFRKDYGITYSGVLHGEEWIDLARPLPAAGVYRAETSVDGLWDRGPEKGAILQTRKRIFESDGNEQIAETRTVLMLRKDGGFGGSAEGAPRAEQLPDRAPDGSVRIATQPDQALIYRLSGDANPLHADPDVAKQAGFPAPILHGMCSYGVIARSIVDSLCGGDQARLRSFGLRFSSPVYPGETLRTDFWISGEGRCAFRAIIVERDVLVATGGQAAYDS